MKKKFVLDTSVLLYDPRSIYQFDDNIIVIPITALEELDHFKKDMTETGRNARHFSRILDEFRKSGSLATGVALENGGTLIVDLFPDAAEHLPKTLPPRINDHLFLAVCLQLRAKDPKTPVIFVTKDVNLRVKADALGIHSVDFDTSNVSIEELFSGYTDFQVPATVVDNFHKDKRFPMEDKALHPNCYVSLIDQRNPKHTGLGRYNSQKKEIMTIADNSQGIWGIKPRNREQAFIMDALLDESISLVSIVGKAGTGKTLLALACGLQKTIDESRYQKLLVSRPVFPLGKDIGYLPGEVEEKLNPWMQPLFDNIDYIISFSGDKPSKPKRSSGRAWQELINQGMLQIEPLTYIRGRSLAYQYLIVDESQNLTPHEIKTIITRAGEGTKVVLTGDCFQIDNPYVDASNNGLTYIVERFKHQSVSAHVTLVKGERSELAELATNLL